MTLRDSSDRNQSRKGNRTFSERLRNKLRRKDRRLLTESLEQRQLLAGPDLIAIQPNDGQVIQDSQVLTNAPRELVFRFDNQTPIDASTIDGGISITRAGIDGSFETASATSDLGTNGQVIVEFRSLGVTQRGSSEHPFRGRGARSQPSRRQTICLSGRVTILASNYLGKQLLVVFCLNNA